MKNKKRLVIIIASGIFLISFVAIAWSSLFSSNLRDNQDPAKQKEMMKLALEGGRLAPFPASATDVTVKTEGSAFTRSFHASFVAPKHDIESWVKDSLALNQTTHQELPDNKVRYIIKPSGNANYAEVTINYILGFVEIYISWG